MTPVEAWAEAEPFEPQMRVNAQFQLVLLLLAALLAGCTGRGPGPERAPSQGGAGVSAPERLRIGALESWPRFTATAQGYDGVDAEVARLVARRLGEPLELRGYAHPQALLQAVQSGEVDLAVGVIWPRGPRLPSGLQGFAYDTGELVGLCPASAREAGLRELTVPRELAPLSADTEILADHSALRLADGGGLGAATLLARAVQGESDCVLAPARLARYWQRYAPGALEASPLPRGYSRYVVYGGRRQALGLRLAGLFVSAELRSLIRRANHEQFGFLDPLPRHHYRLFHRQIERRLPEVEPLFRAAAKRYGLDWPLLAAISYQESHWRPRARSHTGVRGLMMLTLRTARDVGVDDRLDPHQSVSGGARYLRELVDALAVEVQGQDRIWLSLAAYNMGLEGLRRVRRTAAELGLDPNRWSDLAKVMRRSQEAKWREAVIYVERIRDYADIIRYRVQVPT